MLSKKQLPRRADKALRRKKRLLQKKKKDAKELSGNALKCGLTLGRKPASRPTLLDAVK